MSMMAKMAMCHLPILNERVKSKGVFVNLLMRPTYDFFWY